MIKAIIGKKYVGLNVLLAIIVILSSYSIVIAGVFVKADVLLREGTAFFLENAAFRLISGLIISFLAGLPYFLGAFAASKSKYPFGVFLACLAIFSIDVISRIQILFFSSNSTGVIAILFLPFIFTPFVIIAWIIIGLISKLSEKRQSKT